MLLAIELVYVLIAAGRLTNADTGLMNGTILALGTFTSGVHTNWRVAVIGVALGLGTAAVGYVEQYLWILFVLALARPRRHHRRRPDARPREAARRRTRRGRVRSGRQNE